MGPKPQAGVRASRDRKRESVSPAEVGESRSEVFAWRNRHGGSHGSSVRSQVGLCLP